MSPPTPPPSPISDSLSPITTATTGDTDARPIILLEKIVYSDPYDLHEDWQRCLQACLPDFRVDAWDNKEDPYLDKFLGFERVQFAVIWWADLLILSRLPALRGVLLRGSGCDQLEPVSNLRKEVALIRLIDPHSSEHLSRFILHWVLHAQLRLHEYARQNAECVWKPLSYAAIGGGRHESERFVVGVMGYGQLGRRTVRLLYEKLGFDVRVWRRTVMSETERDEEMKQGELGKINKKEGSIEFYTDILDFVSDINVLVNFVPLNEGTRGVINKEVFQRVARGCVLVSVGRGATINIEDTLAALDERRLALAVMDTFVGEPLDKESPLWTHPNVVITPHVAGRSYSYTGAQAMAENIRRMQNGEQPFPVVPH